MKKIITEEVRERKRKRNQLIMSLFLILVMVGSTLGFGYSYYMDNSGNQQNVNKIKYKGFLFENQNGFWTLNKDSKSFIFRYNPQETISNEILLNKADYYTNKVVYIYSEDEIAESEIYVNLNQYTQRIQRVCLSGEKCSEDLPIKTCNDDLIVIKEANSSEIKIENSCVVIQGTKGDLIKLSDEFLFKTLGIK